MPDKELFYLALFQIEQIVSDSYSSFPTERMQFAVLVTGCEYLAMKKSQVLVLKFRAQSRPNLFQGTH